MKYILTISISLLFFFSCKKELSTNVQSDDYLNKVQTGLKDSMKLSDFSSLDFSKAVLSKVDSVNLYVLRVPFKNESFQNDFVVVKTTAEGKVRAGKIVHQEGTATDADLNGRKKKSFNGSISIASLDRKTELNSPIVDGYITAFHTANLSRTALVQPGDVMPEVIITYVIHSSGISWSTWFSLQSYFSEFGNSWGNYYGPYNPDAGGGGSGSNPYSGWPGYYPPGGGGGGGPVYQPPIWLTWKTWMKIRS